ncbi:MAG: hypothetical protein WC758_06855 [Candidatus Woesearchaeota archaeon]|jgi:hypothetical protein
MGIEEEIVRAEQWHVQDEQRGRDLEWNNRPKEVTRFHERLIENMNRIITVADAGKLDYVTNLGGFRIYLVEKENIPYYMEDFEGQYHACGEYFHYRRLNESLIGTTFYALRCREGLEKSTSTENAASAVQQLRSLSTIPFQSTGDIPAIVRKIDDVRENYLGIEKLRMY